MLKVFSDGACLGNPGKGGWSAIIDDGENVTELGGAEQNTTNNRMEMSAVLNAFRWLLKNKDILTDAVRLTVYSDSQYLISGITQWLKGWKRRGWKTSAQETVKNQDLWIAIDKAMEEFEAHRSIVIAWEHVAGHSGIPGNERCDEIANSLAAGRDVSFFRGPRDQYPIELDVTVKSAVEKPYYLSLIHGKIFRDSDWASCEARVRGAKGAKFKKVRSELEEAQVLKDWGVKPSP